MGLCIVCGMCACNCALYMYIYMYIVYVIYLCAWCLYSTQCVHVTCVYVCFVFCEMYGVYMYMYVSVCGTSVWYERCEYNVWVVQNICGIYVAYDIYCVYMCSV